MSSLEKLKERLSKRKVIPFVGAGVSMNVTDTEGNDLFPSWKKLLEKAIEELKTNDNPADANLVDGFLNRQNPDYLLAAKYAREGFGASWNNFLDQQFNPDRNKVEKSSLETAELIWQLGNSLLITTNYDKVLRWTNKDVNIWNIESKFRQGKVVSEGFPQEPTVWHLHGYIDNPSDLILTPDGYQKLYPNESNAETKYKTALQTLHTLLTSYTFLFIGFSLNDTDFVNQIKYISELFDNAAGEHFALMKETDKGNINKLNLPVKPIIYENHGEPLVEMLRELVAVKKDKDSVSIIETHSEQKELTATEKYNPKNRVVHIPFNQKGDQVVGREEDLKNVRETLLKGLPTNIGQAVSFQGLGGLGKTQLAVEYAYKYQDEYPNGVIWLTVDQDIDKQLVEVSDKAGWVSTKSEIKVKLDVALNRLKTITNCLIVLDNVEIFDERIKDYLPDSQNNIHILATSRYELSEFNPVSLKLLTLEQSVQMLKQESRREIKDEELKTVEQIAEELGNLPLTLELAGGFLRHRQAFTWGNYLSLLKQNPREAFKGKFLKGSFTQHDTDVYRTLKVSENILGEEPILRDGLDLLTWSGTSPMGVDLMAKLLGKNEIELLEALSLGESLRLLQKSPERNAFAIHRLVAEVRKEDIPLVDRTDWVNNICQLTGDWFQDIREDFNKLPEYEAELEHLAKWQEHAEKFATENASRLLWLQAYPVSYRGRYQEAKEIVSKAMKLYETTKCQNQEILAHLYNDFSYLSRFLAEYRTDFDYAKKALDIRLKLFGQIHKDTADSYDNLGRAYGELGKYQEQFNNHKKALDIRLNILGEIHKDTANSYSNLGRVYRKWGKYQEEFNNNKKSLDICLELFGEKYPSTATSYNNVGLAYGSLGKHEEELDSYKKALDIYLELFGEKHPFTATSFYNLGYYFNETKSYTVATEFTEKALSLRREMLGNLHPDTLRSVYNLAEIYTNDNKSNEALKLVSEFLRLIPKPNAEHKRLINARAWILNRTKREGFRQQSVNPAKKEGRKKRR